MDIDCLRGICVSFWRVCMEIGHDVSNFWVCNLFCRDPAENSLANRAKREYNKDTIYNEVIL